MATIDQAPPSGVLPGDGPRPNVTPNKRRGPAKGTPRGARAKAHAEVNATAPKDENGDAITMTQDELLAMMEREKERWAAESYADRSNPEVAISKPMTLIDGQRHNTRVAQTDHPGYHFLDVESKSDDGQMTLKNRMSIVSPTDSTRMMFWKFSDDPDITYHPAVTRLVCKIEDFYAWKEIERMAAMQKETHGKGDPLRNPLQPTGTLPEITDTYTIGRGVLPA